jgi:uncharacterized protein YkwD
MPLIPIIAALHVSVPPFRSVKRQMAIEVVDELNRARTNPVRYAASLRTYRGFYRGRVITSLPTANRSLTIEGVALVDEAINFVVRRPRRAPLTFAATLAAAASDLQARQQRDGSIGHRISNSRSDGTANHTMPSGRYVGEMIAYGSYNAADIVRQLIVDDGVSNRGHRTLIFDESIRYAGVSCGSHPIYRYMCVIHVARTKDGGPRALSRSPIVGNDW